jgi:hypothetical protein
VRELDRERAATLAGYLDAFIAYLARGDAGEPPFDLSCCALGNLLFAGAYLQHGRRFNTAVARLAQTLGCRANLVNVSTGENRVLVALKSDGTFLDCEARIVGPQSPAPIVDIFLLAAPLDASERAALEALDLEGRRRFLAALERPVTLSDEARAALSASDLVIYGPGTQFSSLYPSYKTRGLVEAITAGPARVRAMFVNLRDDHDTQGLPPEALVAQALRQLGDPDNGRGAITHVIANRKAVEEPAPAAGATRRLGAAWIEGDFESAAFPGVHNGHRSVAAVLDLLERAHGRDREELDVYVDLHERSLAAHLLVQEFTELDWASRFAKVRLTLNGAATPPVGLPTHLEIHARTHSGLFSDVDVFREWLARGRSEYLATLTGDGEFRLRDIVTAMRVLDSTRFGAIFGSRSQSRLQFRGSLEDAYGESRPLFWISLTGGYVFSALFALRFQALFSDPFTGFRVYRRSAFAGLTPPGRLETPSHISRYLLSSSVEVAEIPVSYRTFQGFTRARTRLYRGLKNAIGLFL